MLAFGGDPNERHTAFRRLPIHEAACNGSKDCLTLLLEISQILGEEKSRFTTSASSTTSLYSGWLPVPTSVAINEDRKPPQNTRCGSKKDSCAQAPEPKLVLADPRYHRMPFLSALKLILELNTKVHDDLLSELEAARDFLCKLGIPQSVRTAFISAIPLSSAIDGHGNTALHWASFKSHCDCVSVLLESGADSNFRSNHFGWTPLHDASYSDSAEVIELLLEKGADINARSNSGATPLCFAAQEDAPHAAELLLKAGADAAAQCNGQQLVHPGNSVAVNSYRIPHTPSRFSGYTPLHYCAHYNSTKASKVLIKYGAPMEIEDFSGRRPIHVAVARGSSDVLQELLYAGTKLETTNIGPASAAAGFIVSSAPSRLESHFILTSVHSQTLESFAANSQMQPQGRFMINPPSSQISETIARQRTTPGQNSQFSAEATPVSSPVLKAMIPPRPVQSSKPWNCLTQQAIDECRYLLDAAEGHWSPRTHKIFSPNDRRAILELLKVGKRMEQMNKGYFLELWPEVLSFCGRGWFEPVAKMNGPSPTSSNCYDMEEDFKLPATHQASLLREMHQETMIEDGSVTDDANHDNDEGLDFTQFHLESDDSSKCK